MKLGLGMAGVVALCCGVPLLATLITSGAIASIAVGVLANQLTIGLVVAGVFIGGVLVAARVRASRRDRPCASTASGDTRES